MVGSSFMAYLETDWNVHPNPILFVFLIYDLGLDKTCLTYTGQAVRLFVDKRNK
jgi:hypothetical protein